MMNSRVRTMVAVVFSIAWATAATAQGLYWESTGTGNGGTTRTAKNYAMPKMMKIVEPDGQVIILRSDQDKFITIDTKKQTYRELTFAELESAAKSTHARMEAAQAGMEKRMKEMPPEQRAIMEKMLPKMPGADAAKPAATVVKNTGETKIVSGYSCTKWVATEDGKTVLVAWTTKDAKGFAGLRDDWLAYQKRLLSTNRMFGSALADAYTKIEGFPMETEIGNMKTVVTKIEPRTIAASEFDVPAGYKKENSELPKAPQL